MKKSLKYISLILAILFVITGSVLIASATDDPGVDPGTGETPVDTPGTGEDPVDEPGTGEEPVDTPGTGEEPVDTPVTGDDPVDNPISNDDPWHYYEEDPLWYGDSSVYGYGSGDNDRSAGSVSDSTSLFSTSGISDEDVAPNAWTNITLDEKNVTKSTGSFSAIKSNTNTADNGQWILYLGYGLIILSVLGILYFIVATVSARRDYRPAAIAVSDSAPAQAKTSAKAAPRHGAAHFADDGDASSRRASKSDTGEIYVPRRIK